MILLVDKEGSDQTEQVPRLIWTFAVRICPKTHVQSIIRAFVLHSYIL